MDDIRVLFVSGEYPPLRGGVADYTALLRGALMHCGVESIVLTAEGADGDGVFTLGSWSWPVALHIRELVQMHPVDLVHIQYQAGAFDMHPAINALPTALGAWLRLPVLTTFHDLRAPYLFPKAGRLRQAVMLRMARASRHVIVTNPGDQRILEDAEIRTVRIPIGPSLQRPQSDSLSVNGTEPQVAFFGFPSREKGIEELIRAIAMFDVDSRPTLVLVGASRPDTGTHAYLTDQDVDRLAGELGVKIERTGYLPPDEAAFRLATANVLALPFQHGASLRSSALVTALAMGRPVVTTGDDLHEELGPLASLPQLIGAPPGEPAAIHAALHAALANNIEAEDLPSTHSWPAIAEAHHALYRGVLSKK